MWQTYAIGSLVAGAFESAADKAGIVHDSRVDSHIASFYRALFFGIATTVVGFSGILGEFHFFASWILLPLIGIGALSTLLFTYLLRTVEITSITAASYLAPFFFLLLDSAVLHTPFTTVQLVGITLLVVGGIAFSLDGSSHHLKREFTIPVVGAIIFIFLFDAGLQNYLFKYVNASMGINGPSFFGTLWLCTAFTLLCSLCITGKVPRLVAPASLRYVPYALIGKAFDAFNTLLFAAALTMASVAQVSAFNALFPLVVFIVAMLTQSFLGIGLRERLDAKNMHWKLGSALLLLIGGFLVG